MPDMLEDAITGRRIKSLSYPKDFDRLRARLTEAEFDAITEALNQKLDETPIGKSNSVSWIPGSNWMGTVFMPIYTKACRGDEGASALFLGNAMKLTVICHGSLWRSVKQPKLKTDPEGIETTLYWRVD